MLQEKALAFVDTLVGVRQSEHGGVVQRSPEAVTHLHAILGYGNVPCEDDIVALINTTQRGYIVTPYDVPEFRRGLRRLSDLAQFLREAGKALDEAIVVPLDMANAELRAQEPKAEEGGSHG